MNGLEEIVDKAVGTLNKGAIMVYVGGYNGRRAQNYLERVPMEMHIFEPCKKNYKIMVKRLKKFNAHAHQMAMGRTTGDGSLYIWNRLGDEGTSQNNSLYKKHLAGKADKIKKRPIETITLEDFIKREEIKKIDLLKLNCEGGEYDIIYSDLSIVKMIAVSFHAKNEFFNSDAYAQKRKEIYEHLEKQGFKLITGEKLLKSKRHIDHLWKKSA